jgi:chromosome segregation protein
VRIRRLELFGFKSFKDKTIVSFDQPITAIVGSNGCGKSNVVDALYWVMGDMSPKHLRGHSMVDVIFSGSRDSAPLDMAEVTLVLERDPATDPELPPQFQASLEIQITRRYYRSGDSEYLINRVPCRLRDIQEFFMDTGVGAKAYSIIEQGAISRLVTQKPEDRRVVIEEVAGVLKFKARKAETERKIENSRINLTRIDDILKDLQKQLGTLKRQAEKAERFRAYSDELKQLEIQMGCQEWITRSETKGQALLMSGELSQIKSEKEAALYDRRSRLEALAEELQNLEEELAARRGRARESELRLKDLGTSIATVETKRDGLTHRLESDEGALQQIEARSVELASEIEIFESALQEAQEHSHALAEQVEAQRMEADSLRERTEGLREEFETVRRQLHTEELEQTRFTQQIQSHQRNLNQIDSRCGNLDAQIHNIDGELELRQAERSSTLEHLEVAFSTRTDLEQAKEEVDTELERLETSRTELQSQRDGVRDELSATKIRKEQLEALDRDLAGVDAAGKALAKNLREGRGENEALLLADHIRVPSLLEKAVEAVFGRNLQRVVGSGLGEIKHFRDLISRSNDPSAKTGRMTVWVPEMARHRLLLGGDLQLNSIYMPRLPAQTVRMNGGADALAEFGPSDDAIAQATPVDGAFADAAFPETPGFDGGESLAPAQTDTDSSSPATSENFVPLQADGEQSAIPTPNEDFAPLHGEGDSASVSPVYARSEDFAVISEDRPGATYTLSEPSASTPGPDGLVEMEAAVPAFNPTIEKVPTVRDFLMGHPGVVGPLYELIKAESPAGADLAWLNLVRDVWVVRDTDTIEELHPLLAGLPVSFVTLAGDVVTKDGYVDLTPVESIPGAESLGLIQRKREISELRATATRLEGELRTAQDRLDACIQAIAREKEKFRELTTRLAALNPDVEKHSLLLRQVEAQLARLSEKQTLLREDLERSRLEKEEITQRVAELTEQLSAAEGRREETRARLDELDGELKSLLALLRDAEQKLQGLSQDQKRHDQKTAELQTKRATAEQERTLSSARRQHLDAGIVQLRSEIEALVAELELVREERLTQETIFETFRAEEREAKDLVEQGRAGQSDLQRQADLLGEELQSVMTRQKDVDQELAVNDVEIRNLKERIMAQYQISLDELTEDKLRELATPADLEIIADFEAARRHTANLRSKIDNLGKINMVAVEEYESVSQRYEYLFIQRQDLYDAITQLVDAIDRIDKESRHRFAEAFTAVNEAFRTTFPVLFGGGQAELRLTNPDNMLETGVDIVAQPPGKKLQSVTLLSGGEKALTAVSLIFGIFSIKPSPFCVLDEVDAPLDDANVARFNTQVRRMSETSQIIMITHHKKTMESCDGLFGVTMEKPGISNIASAKLSELKNA